MLRIPGYIEQSGDVGAPIKYRWNDEDMPTFYTESDRIQSMIAKTTTAGAVALGLGCLEWVCWRLSKSSDVAVALSAIEALWAAIIDENYASSLRQSALALKRPAWQGPTRGPVYFVYKQLKGLQECIELKEPASPEASSAVRFGRFVSAAPKVFDQWWRLALKRLADAHPASEEGPNDIGKPIPREAIDPAVDYKPSDDKRYLAAFLKGLDPASNQFLVPAREMKKAGFKGEPVHDLAGHVGNAATFASFESPGNRDSILVGRLGHRSGRGTIRRRVLRESEPDLGPRDLSAHDSHRRVDSLSIRPVERQSLPLAVSRSVMGRRC